MAGEAEYVKKVESWLDVGSKTLGVGFKLALLIGGTFLLFYSYHIDHFPSGVSLGDTFVLIFLAASFGIVYGFLVASLTGLGIWFKPLFVGLNKMWCWSRKRVFRRKVDEPFPFVSPDMNATIFAFFGVVFIIIFGTKEPSTAWSLLSISILLGAMFSFQYQLSSRLGEKKRERERTVHANPVSRPRWPFMNEDWLRNGRFAVLSVMIFAPLALGGVSGFILDETMRFAHVRKDACVVLLREPYSRLLPTSLQTKRAVLIPEFTAFERVNVAFSGIGQKSVIEFRDGARKLHYLDVPNEAVIVIP